MKFCRCLTLLFLLIIVITALCLKCEATSCSKLWPKPKSLSCGEVGSFRFLDKESFQFEILDNKSSFKIKSPLAVINDAVKRYHKLIFSHYNKAETQDEFNPSNFYDNNNNVGILNKLEISIDDLSMDLTYGVSESYTLSVTNQETATLKANTVWGALRGLETFSQLIQYQEQKKQNDNNENNENNNENDQDKQNKNGFYIIPEIPININDEPRFKWRGIMADTARHFISLPFLLHVVDSLSYNKMNVLHIHFTDIETFSVDISSLPEFREKSTWNKNHAFYSKNDLEYLTLYAYFRGVRIIPEVDMPGHTKSWGRAYPKTIPNCPNVKDSYKVALNVPQEETYQVVEKILDQMTQQFPDEYFHIGGDEVGMDCWKADSSVRRFMQQKGWGSGGYTSLWAYFQERIEPFWRKRKKAVCWQEMLLKGNKYALPKDTIVQVWLGKKNLIKAVRSGYNAIVSAGWYLDILKPGQPRYHYNDVWIDFYQHEPFSDPGWNEELKNKVFGGEACMWGEQTDENNWDARVWPRASAVAERLWSPANVRDLDNAKSRLRSFRCKMVQRGVRSGDVWTGYCPTHDIQFNGISLEQQPYPLFHPKLGVCTDCYENDQYSLNTYSEDTPFINNNKINGENINEKDKDVGFQSSQTEQNEKEGEQEVNRYWTLPTYNYSQPDPWQAVIISTILHFLILLGLTIYCIRRPMRSSRTN